MINKQLDNITFKRTRQEIISKISLKKMENENVIKILQELEQQDKAYFIEQCGTFLEISHCEDCGDKITDANFCRQRFCAVCATRRQAKFISQMAQVIDRVQILGYKENDYAFLTLTIKNCIKSSLKQTITNLLMAFKKLTNYKFMKDNIIGYVRSLEVTYNKKEDTYHPHMHIFIIKKNYISQKKITELWKKALEIDYDPICNIRKIEDTTRSCVETIKYSLKLSQACHNKDVFTAFETSLRNRRLISFGGLLAEIRRELKLTEVEDDTLTDDITKHKENCRYCNSEIIKTLYHYNTSAGIYEIMKEVD